MERPRVHVGTQMGNKTPCPETHGLRHGDPDGRNTTHEASRLKDRWMDIHAELHIRRHKHQEKATHRLTTLIRKT